MIEHCTLLRRVYRLPVLPIVVYVRGARGSERWEKYREEQFLPLPAEEEQRFRQLANQEEHEMAKLVDYETWRNEQWLQAKREDVLTVLRTRFGPVPEEWERRVEAMASLPELDALLVRLLKASRLEEVE